MIISNKIIILTVFAFYTVTAFANELVTPEWRGQEGTTFQHWRFDANGNPAIPESLNNPYGQPQATMTIGDFGDGWNDDLSLGLTGLWNLGGLGGSVLLDIPSQSSTVEYQDIFIQVVYYVDLAETPTIDIQNAELVNEEAILFLDDPPLGKWELRQSQWRISPVSNQLQITLTSNPTWGTVIDQISVDTISVPVDCIVDLEELIEFSQQWLLSGSDLKYDLNNDDHVNLIDFSIISNSWLGPCPW